MSAFSGMFALARAHLMAQQGQSVTFQPADREAATETVRAIVGAIDVDYVQGEQQGTKFQRRQIQVPLTTAEGGPSERRRGGIYSLPADDSTTEAWTVELELRVDREAGLAVLDLRRPLKLDTAGRGERVARQMNGSR
jgi:hypothetical protein